MESVHIVRMLGCIHRIHSVRPECAEQILICHHVRCTSLAVHLVMSVQAVICLRVKRPVWTATAYGTCSRMRDVAHSRMELRNDVLAEFLVYLCRRHTFVTAYINCKGGVVADSLHIVLGIVQEHLRIVRIRTVPRVRKPEVLPDHYSVPVAGLIEFLIADLAHPVAYDGEIHICVVCHSGIILASAVVEVGLAEAPVSSETDEAPSIDEH